MTQKSELKPEYIYAVIALVLAFVAYQAFVVVPQKKIEAQQAEAAVREMKLNSCNGVAYENYNATWESECTRLSRGENCALPTSLSESIGDIFENEKNRCVTLYK